MVKSSISISSSATRRAPLWPSIVLRASSVSSGWPQAHLPSGGKGRKALLQAIASLARQPRHPRGITHAAGIGERIQKPLRPRLRPAIMADAKARHQIIAHPNPRGRRRRRYIPNPSFPRHNPLPQPSRQTVLTHLVLCRTAVCLCFVLF